MPLNEAAVWKSRPQGALGKDSDPNFKETILWAALKQPPFTMRVREWEGDLQNKQPGCRPPADHCWHIAVLQVPHRNGTQFRGNIPSLSICTLSSHAWKTKDSLRREIASEKPTLSKEAERVCWCHQIKAILHLGYKHMSPYWSPLCWHNFALEQGHDPPNRISSLGF